MFYIVFIKIIVNKTEHVFSTLRLFCLFQEHTSTVWALQFDAFQVVSGGYDKTIVCHNFFETSKLPESRVTENITEKGTPSATTTGKSKYQNFVGLVS